MKSFQLPIRATVAAVLLSVAFVAAADAQEVRLSAQEAAEVGRKIWMNESGGKVEGLTAWNTGEKFPSLGIGHFIWYPEGVRGPFDESFPELVAFLDREGVRLPGWLTPKTPSAWRTREEFQREFNSARMKELRRMLAETVPQQTRFLIERLEKALPKMLAAARAKRRDHVRTQFYRVANAKGGAFALIDYVNFKGEGVLETERYKGEGWGMLQVLENMSGTSGDPVAEFSKSAAETLTRRVKNAPAERKEERWLPGWKNRVGRY